MSETILLGKKYYKKSAIISSSTIYDIIKKYVYVIPIFSGSVRFFKNNRFILYSKKIGISTYLLEEFS